MHELFIPTVVLLFILTPGAKSSDWVSLEEACVQLKVNQREVFLTSLEGRFCK